MFIQTELTPNPNAMKFYAGRDISATPIFCATVTDAHISDLAISIFNINRIKSVFFGSDFITVTKEDDVDWCIVKPEILTTMMDYFVRDLPIFRNANAQATSLNLDDLTEIEKQIVDIIETKVRPSVAMDGGDIVYRGFKDGIVSVELKGACSGCPSSLVTLKNGIESMLQFYVPEVIAVEAMKLEGE